MSYVKIDQPENRGSGKGEGHVLGIVNGQDHPLINRLPKHLDILLVPCHGEPRFINVREECLASPVCRTELRRHGEVARDHLVDRSDLGTGDDSALLLAACEEWSA